MQGKRLGISPIQLGEEILHRKKGRIIAWNEHVWADGIRIGKDKRHQRFDSSIQIVAAARGGITKQGKIQVEARFALPDGQNVWKPFTVKAENRQKQHIMVKRIQLCRRNEQVITLIYVRDGLGGVLVKLVDKDQRTGVRAVFLISDAYKDGAFGNVQQLIVDVVVDAMGYRGFAVNDLERHGKSLRFDFTYF